MISPRVPMMKASITNKTRNGANFLDSQDSNSNHHMFPELIRNKCKKSNLDNWMPQKVLNSVFSPPPVNTKTSLMFPFDEPKTESKLGSIDFLYTVLYNYLKTIISFIY